MENTTLILAVILGTGFLLASLGRLVRFPAVTGYIFAGVLLGPMGINLLNLDQLGNRLEHFNQLALMLVAFGIGEHLEFRRIRGKGKIIGAISALEVAAASLVVGVTTFGLLTHSRAVAHLGPDGPLVMSLLLAAVAVATAPAATLHVVRESQASGKLSSTLLQIVALDNVAAIVFFVVARSAARMLTGGHGGVLPSIGAGLSTLPISLALGVFTGLAIDFIVHRLDRRADMLTAGLALLLLCGEGARTVGLSPLLAGMAAGCTIVNRDHRDVRLFRAVNEFEPPIYVLFFTLAGAHLNFPVLKLAGGLGLAYFLARAGGKAAGAWLGAVVGRATSQVRNYLGISLIPQAGLAIGLLFLIESDPALGPVSKIMTPVVLTGVLLSELFGPVIIKHAIERSGESSARPDRETAKSSEWASLCELDGEGACSLVPWTWPRLRVGSSQLGSVLVGAAHLATVGGLTRMGALFASHLGSRLIVAHVRAPGERSPDAHAIAEGARSAAREIGYPVRVTIVEADQAREGLVGFSREEDSRMILLGCPLEGTDQGFQQVVDRVAHEAPCQVVVLRFSGTLHTERILVPITDLEEADALSPVLGALGCVGEHRITMIWLRQAETPRPKLERAERKMADWAKERGIRIPFRCRAVATESRLQAVVEEAENHDFIVMAASRATGLTRYFFGSLATDVARRCRKSMMLVHAVHGRVKQVGEPRSDAP